MEEGPPWLISVLCLWVRMLGGGGGHEESILRLMESFSFPLIDSVDPEVSFLKWENLSPCPPHSVFSLKGRAVDSPGPRILIPLCSGPMFSCMREAPADARTEKKKFLIRETRSVSLPRNLPASEKLMDSPDFFP